MVAPSEESIIILAAKAVVDCIVSCDVSAHRQSAIYNAFRSILSFRFCLASLPGSDVLLSTNLIHGGEVMFVPVEAAKSCSREVATQCRPCFIAGNNAAYCSELAVIMKQEASKAFFCVPLPTNYQPAGDGQASTSTRSHESPCIGTIIIGIQAENEVAEQDLRTALLIARHIAVNHRTKLESLIAGIAPILSTSNDPDSHPGWGDAAGLLQPLRRRVSRVYQNERARERLAQANHAGTSHASGSTSRHNESPQLDESIEDDTSDDDDAPITSNFTGSVVLTPIQYALLQSTHRFTLAFPHPFLEKQYKDWRGNHMARVDGAALFVLLAYHMTRSGNKTGDPSNDGGGGVIFGNFLFSWIVPFFTAISQWNYFPCAIIMIPFLLAVVPVTRKWYSQRRDYFAAGLYIILSCHHIIAGAVAGTSVSFWNSSNTTNTNNSASTISTQQQEQQHVQHGWTATQTLISWTAVLIELMSSVDSLWIAVLSVILNVRYPWQTIMLVIAATVSFLVALPVCPGGEEALPCWATAVAQVVVGQMFLPGIVMYWLEYGVRRAFCATPAASYFAYRLNLTRRN